MHARIDASLLDAIAARAAGMALGDDSLAHLRREWPGIHFTLCDDDDVPARVKPALSGDGFNLYLVSNAEHCIAFTSQMEAASGIVLGLCGQD